MSDAKRMSPKDAGRMAAGLFRHSVANAPAELLMEYPGMREAHARAKIGVWYYGCSGAFQAGSGRTYCSRALRHIRLRNGTLLDFAAGYSSAWPGSRISGSRMSRTRMMVYAFGSPRTLRTFTSTTKDRRYGSSSMPTFWWSISDAK